MVNKLYKTQYLPQEEPAKMNISTCRNCKDWWLDSFAWLCCRRKYFCKADRKQKEFFKARELLLREINIIDIIKSRRYIGSALKYLLDKKQRRKLEKQSRYIILGRQ